MTPSSRLFLAHASEDKPAVRQLYQELKARGFEPWLDTEDLLPGQFWKVEIPKAIREATVFLACLSSRSVAKVGYVNTEFRLALAAFGQRPSGSIYLIPVRLDQCEVPDLQIPDLGLGLRDVQWVDLFAENGLDRLVRALREGAGITPASSAPSTAPVPLQVLRDIHAPLCPEIVVIPAGRFVMGSPDYEEGRHNSEGPLHFVTIAEPFALGRYPVTFDEYDEFAATTRREPPGDSGWGRGRRPAIDVSWHDAQTYVAWLSGRTGATYRLPSEAEWEYACRAGTTICYSFGDAITPQQANYGDSVGKTTEVGSFPANRWGLYDMHGNAWEWCADVWHNSYEAAPTDGSAWLEKGNNRLRVQRGGSWNDVPRDLRSANREGIEADDRDYIAGFRVAKTLR